MSIDPTTYDAQLQEKVALTRSEFAPYFDGELAVYESPRKHYRMRAEFRVWHEGEDLNYVMFNQQTKERYVVEQFPVASELINQAMSALLDKVRVNDLLRTKLFQVDFLSSLSGELVISLLYHKPLTDEWEQAVETLKAELMEQGINASFIGRARKMKRIIGVDYVTERLSVFDQSYLLRQFENSFTQPNGQIAQKMLEWCKEKTRQCSGDLLELYCGNGNFSVALAENFDSVLATELAKSSVHAAQWNIEANKVPNLKILRLSAEELTDALDGKRTFRRLEQAEVDLAEYDFQTVLVDPPRAGIDEDSLRTLQRYPRILYISCNPETLRENLEILSETHEVTEMALFDQFPYTHHREVGIILEQR